MMRRLIVNADDFGQSPGINRGIIQSYEQGIVTSASLMVRWPAAVEAADYGKNHPELSLGLHFDLGEWIYRDGDWNQLYQVVPPEDKDAVAAELNRQIETFRSLVGRDPTHLDSHQHVHRKEPVRSLMLDLAHNLGVPLREYTHGIRYCGAFYGQTANGEPLSGAITVNNLVNVLNTLTPGITEMVCHPGLGNDLQTMYLQERSTEVQTLCDSRVREAISAEEIELSSFAGLPEHCQVSPPVDKNQFVFVLGMHRSGTSCLTGALEACGLLLGDVNRANRDNLRGNQENKNVRKLNDSILAFNHGRWDQPPPSLVITEEHRASIRKCLSGFPSQRIVGIKDPRIVLLADAWLTVAKSFLLVGTFRHPMAVALSLQKRNSLPIEQGLRLWNHYNDRLMQLHEAYKFPLIEYDLDHYDLYCEKVASFAGTIGLTNNVEGIQQFVSSDLQRSNPIPGEIPPECQKLYLALKQET